MNSNLTECISLLVSGLSAYAPCRRRQNHQYRIDDVDLRNAICHRGSKGLHSETLAEPREGARLTCIRRPKARRSFFATAVKLYQSVERHKNAKERNGCSERMVKEVLLEMSLRSERRRQRHVALIGLRDSFRLAWGSVTPSKP
jgi:hypothetical protein